MKIKLKSRQIHGFTQIYSDGDEADALFLLLKRGHIETLELPLLAKIGLDVKITGDTKRLLPELRNIPHEFNRIRGEITLKKKCGQCGTTFA